ncbi:MAG: hypothetical protein AB8A46_09220 [Prochlorococcus sp.]|nr:hypothetical protein [Prochlorococcaceae cyanobacterium ETNP18_MAG_1]
MANSKDSLQKGGDRWLPILFLVLAFWDLRTEIRLLWDHFTITELTFAFRYHALAVVVLFSVPSLWRRYGPSRRSLEKDVAVEVSRD